MVSRLTGTDVDLETPIAAIEPGHAVRVAIRAGDILIATERPRGLSARNIVAGTIATLTRQGAIVQARVDVGVPIEVHITPSSSEELQLHPGDAVWLVVKTHSCRPVSAV
jgi:molybdate transport system ATP-binding protein